MVWATARGTAQITSPSGSWFIIRWIAASAVGGPLFLAAIALAVIHDAASVMGTLQTPNALRAFAGVFAVHALGAVIGVGSQMGHRLFGRLGLPGWLTETIRPAAIGAAVLLALSGLVVAASLVVHWGTMHRLVRHHRLVSRASEPDGAVAAVPAQRRRRRRGGRGRLQRSHRVRDLQRVHRLRRRHPRPADPGRGARAAAGSGLGRAADRRGGGRGGAGAAVRAAAAAAARRVRANWRSRPRWHRLAWPCWPSPEAVDSGNFGHVGVDQATFAPGLSSGSSSSAAMTVVMAGGVSPRQAKPAPAPVAERTAMTTTIRPRRPDRRSCR